MVLPFLQKAYLPSSGGKPKHEAVFNEILSYQNKKDNSGRMYLPPASSGNKDGMFNCPSVEDPMECMGYDLALRKLTFDKYLSFAPDELEEFPDPTGTRPLYAPGITASVELQQDHCGIRHATGSMKMMRVWDKVVDAPAPSGGGSSHEYTGRQELFEMYFSFDVSFSGMYSGKGHGSGQEFCFAFWAVRARRDQEGKEIGLKVPL